MVQVPTETGVIVAVEMYDGLPEFELDPTVQIDVSSDSKETVNPVAGPEVVLSSEIAEIVTVEP